jgi:hypothetical protein
MAAKACPICGLKNPSRSTRCDCGYRFKPVSHEKRVCPDCGSEWTSATPQCSCGHWFDEEAREAKVMFASKLTKGWFTLIGGAALLVAPVVGVPFKLGWLIGAGLVIAKGMHAVAYASHGLRAYKRPRLARVKPPEARLIERR